MNNTVIAMSKRFILSLILIGVLSYPIYAAETQYADLSSPRNAAKRYFQSLKKGDVKTFKTTIHASEEYVQALSKIVEMATALLKLEKTIKKKYKDDETVKAFMNQSMDLESFEKNVKKPKCEGVGKQGYHH